MTLPRVCTVNHERTRRIDYRHLIAALVRKPQAFRYSQLREDLLPNATYRAIWRHLDSRLEPRAACKRILGILALAARAECERALGEYLGGRIAAGDIPSLHALEQRFDPPDTSGAGGDHYALGGEQHALSLYDRLLPSSGQSMEVH